ncbi:MAG: phage portal protein [Cyanobacteria bacterium P01_A01_bin.84]
MILSQAFSEIRNAMTGLGTERDKSTYTEINVNVVRLPDIALQNLPRISGMLERAVFLHILHAFRGDWFNLVVGESEDPEPLQKYMRELKGGFSYSLKRTAALGRQWGDGFALLGIDDGLPPDQPVNEEAIASVRWIKSYTMNQVRVEWGRGFGLIPHDPEHYRLYMPGEDLPDYGAKTGSGIVARGDRRIIQDFLWHKSRVIRFSGKYLYDEALRESGGYHDSVIQAMFNSWLKWKQGLTASSAMLQDYDQFTLGIEGLGQLVNPEGKTEAEKTEATQKILHRAMTLDMGRSITRGILYDKTLEEPGSLTRSYSGADQIMQRLEDAWSAASGVPKFKLFNQIGATGLATGVQAATIMKVEWAIAVSEYLADTCKDEISKLAQYCMRAGDSPISSDTDTLKVDFPLNVIFSQIEIAEIQKLISERDKNNIESGLYTGLEARYAYERSQFDVNLNLEPMEVEREQSRDSLLRWSQTRHRRSLSVSDSQTQGEELRIDDATRVQKIITWQGFKIGLQYLPFQKRHGKVLPVAYGWIGGTKGADNMALDCYFVPMPENKVFVVEQYINGEFDEEKFIIGAKSLNQARDIYLQCMPREFLGSIRKENIEYINSFKI